MLLLVLFYRSCSGSTDLMVVLPCAHSQRARMVTWRLRGMEKTHQRDRPLIQCIKWARTTRYRTQHIPLMVTATLRQNRESTDCCASSRKHMITSIPKKHCSQRAMFELVFLWLCMVSLRKKLSECRCCRCLVRKGDVPSILRLLSNTSIVMNSSLVYLESLKSLN